MSIEYTVLDDARWMAHDARANSYETECDGCKLPLPRWVSIITDRSGSEHAATHVDRPDCTKLAIAWLDE